VSAVRDPAAAVLRINDRLLAAHPDLYGTDPRTRALSLARALASGPAWASVRDRARLVVRPATSRIGLFGPDAPADRPLVESLGWHVDDLLRRLRPVSFTEAAAAAFDLADRLRTTLGLETLGDAKLVPVPRGGLIVAGLLAYGLGIRTGSDDAGPSPLTIVVDDCSISGHRVREALERLRGERIVVALLHAHPDLARVIGREPGVVACVAARELVDHAPQRPDYRAWKERWTARSPQGLWTGDPDHVCYPWNEPDSLFWNAERARAEPAWRVVPPEWCMKNRAEGHPEDLQILEATEGRLSPSADVVWAEHDNSILVAGTESGTTISLVGSAAVMWRAVIETGERNSALDRVFDHYGATADQLRTDFDRFAAELVERQVLAAA
jgi:hypothetical protein